MSRPHPSFTPSLAGQVAFVTGASSGLGHRFAETLASVGAAVNAIAPGLFRSEMSEAHLARVGEKALRGTQRKRVGEPHQLDSTLLYLVSPASEFVTGTCIRVDDAQFPR
jgi:NAD(P)-dependent dehydrogenase (short-subunit alcohol dehydrogenase family)